MNNNSDSTQVSATEKKSLVQKYLQNPFSLAWSKLSILFQASPVQREPEASEQSGYYEPDTMREQDFYPRFTDRVDPSLYYTVFCHHKRF